MLVGWKHSLCIDLQWGSALTTCAACFCCGLRCMFRSAASIIDQLIQNVQRCTNVIDIHPFSNSQMCVHYKAMKHNYTLLTSCNEQQQVCVCLVCSVLHAVSSPQQLKFIFITCHAARSVFLCCRYCSNIVNIGFAWCAVMQPTVADLQCNTIGVKSGAVSRHALRVAVVACVMTAHLVHRLTILIGIDNMCKMFRQWFAVSRVFNFVCSQHQLSS